MPTLKLIGTPVFASVVIPPGGTTVGTRRVFSENLREANSNQIVGQHSGTCTLVREPAFWLCHAGWTLNNVGPGAGKTGTLVAGGLLDFTSNDPVTVGIFGGTGDFDKIRGEIEAEPSVTTPNDWDYAVAYTS